MTTTPLHLADELPSLLVPARVTCFGTRQIRRRTMGVGWQGWNDDPRMADRMARLPGSGSFYWPGAWQAYRAARAMMRDDATITQAKIETISGREIGRIYREQ